MRGGRQGARHIDDFIAFARQKPPEPAVSEPTATARKMPRIAVSMTGNGGAVLGENGEIAE
jgi:hypothetical protein